MIVNIKFLLNLEMFEIMGYKLAYDQMTMTEEHMNLICLGNYCDFRYKSWIYDVICSL